MTLAIATQRPRHLRSPATAEPSVRPASGPALALDGRESALLSLLLAGHTDASAARRLQISPRTVTNILRALMDRAGVNNRFQLGVVLGRSVSLPSGSPARPRPAARP
ncbi:LuxR C-terminal-related transcriptional regulator [Dactylosporangium sp. CA-139066]|uniref:LuxR C-terminal-related transcriptional regulator n=1 Tax=Dactylosporangium sp. CA-139066 TaxID=3239930 RepID=UPI003D8F456D